MVPRELAVEGTRAPGYGSVRQYHHGQNHGPQLSRIGMDALFASFVPLGFSCPSSLAFGHEEGVSLGREEECFKTLYCLRERGKGRERGREGGREEKRQREIERLVVVGVAQGTL